MAALLVRRREILAQGAEPIGWKVGFNLPKFQRKLGIEAPLAGFLTTDGLLEDGAEWSLGDQGEVVVESEVAVEIGNDGRSIAAVHAAIELADPPDLDQDVDTILAGNIFHRAVAFGPRAETRSPGGARILLNGEVQHEVADAGTHLEEMIAAVAGRLEEADEELRAGDRIITGVLAPPHKANPGDTVRLELEEAGGVELRFT